MESKSKNESNQEVTRKIERRTALRSNELVVLEIDVSAQEQLEPWVSFTLGGSRVFREFTGTVET